MVKLFWKAVWMKHDGLKTPSLLDGLIALACVDARCGVARQKHRHARVQAIMNSKRDHGAHKRATEPNPQPPQPAARSPQPAARSPKKPQSHPGLDTAVPRNHKPPAAGRDHPAGTGRAKRRVCGGRGTATRKAPRTSGAQRTTHQAL